MRRILTITAAALLLTMTLPVSAQEPDIPEQPVTEEVVEELQNTPEQPVAEESTEEPQIAALSVSKGCTVCADSVSGRTGETVEVSIRMENNPGFTNFGIALDYDREKLELVSIQLTDDQGNPYLCGSWADSNIAWESENGSYGYVVCALAEEAAEDGVLFTATFRVADGADAEAAVTPVVKYLRSYEEQDLSFGAVDCTVAAGSVTVEAGEPLLMGDVNDDGELDTLDALLVYRAYIGLAELTEDQQLVADINEDGEWDTLDALLIYRVYKGA